MKYVGGRIAGTLLMYPRLPRCSSRQPPLTGDADLWQLADKEAGQVLEVEPVTRLTPTLAVKVTTVRTPTHLLGWLPIVWIQVLFPGAAPAAEPWRWRPFAMVFLLSGVLLYPCVSFHLFEPDEGRYAQIPREMLTADEWIVPTLQGEPYLDKPPLFYWLVMLSYALFGYHDGAARLIPALAMHAAVLLTYAIGRRMVGERSAFWGALLLTVSPIFLGVGRLLTLDGLLTLWITLGLCAAYLAQTSPCLRRNCWLIAALACGLGVLTKGPVALVLVLVPLLCQRRLIPEAARISWRAWAVFLSIVMIVNLPWYVAVCVRRPEFVRYFLWQHNVQRFVEPFDHVRPVWFYGPIALYGLLPIALLAWPLGKFLTSTQPDDAKRRCRALGFLLLAGVWCIGFFSLAGSKLPTYILPAFPPLCLALGCFVARTEWHRSRWLFGLVAFCWLVQATANYYLIPEYARDRSPVNQLEEVRACCENTPVVCFPRNVDSAAFYLGRGDFRTYRSKDLEALVHDLQKQPRTVVLFGHRNSPETLARHLPRNLRLGERRPLGLCEMAVIERHD
jgi:4-amino-4-deoxy-L-arabinose transferase-like glycosyltransferase